MKTGKLKPLRETMSSLESQPDQYSLSTDACGETRLLNESLKARNVLRHWTISEELLEGSRRRVLENVRTLISC
ncbi:hypothetical protein PoB_000431300 [Plakobranchus ocellatus]|uniref:Uncharacterized protein n=1 Tax=Plakobranchus ocellatus TaxID=259542 RepID=A0AAV3Y5H4_9GAST|nr:hypothetical protein PoB_000431300 [Plakobranchus ocellatus]